MRRRLSAAPCAALAMLGLAAPLPAAAHHSYAMFDNTRTLKVAGTVAKLEWSNPHVFLWVYVKKPEGGYALYPFESDAVNRLTRLGWSPAAIPAGEKVVVEYNPLRDGRPGGKLASALLASGKLLSTTVPPGSPAAGGR